MELLDIVDENGKPIGETVERKTAHSEGIRHRTAHVWIVRKSDEGAEVLLQKRAMNKDSFPGRYDTSIDELTLQKEELDSVEWFNLEYVYEECRKHNQKFCAPVGGLEIVRRFVRGTGL